MREKTRVDTIYQTLRDRICLGQYQPGDVFHETDLGQEFQVSRTPIRQVLQRLAFEKLAVVRTGVGTIVEDFTEADARNYLEIHARILETITELELFRPATDQHELLANLQVRASMLSGTPDAEQIWTFLKAIQSLTDQFLIDDTLRHINELLFYRASRALMAGVCHSPDQAAAVIRDNVPSLIAALEKSDYSAFFIALRDLCRAYKSLAEGN
ncbi:GntR family transcriptional regulator [Breoghania sp.]|uniref:GntR family transcriptional regulator n=1 Tax=Breoghania sp. TaxID=2065378 RepID=UPI00262880F5|nr:GntR family transcriptional regulator [Breoghania sp.]MDJ0933424.1 GntR family transcriptional regulator [Breoghania sp.]